MEEDYHNHHRKFSNFFQLETGKLIPLKKGLTEVTKPTGRGGCCDF
jgi:hypothetical protein